MRLLKGEISSPKPSLQALDTTLGDGLEPLANLWRKTPLRTLWRGFSAERNSSLRYRIDEHEDARRALAPEVRRVVGAVVSVTSVGIKRGCADIKPVYKKGRKVPFQNWNGLRSSL